MSTETEAVAEITKIMNRCPHLEAVFDTFDRVPLTDGHIDLYASGRRATTDYRDRIPVQIKGRSRARKPPMSFSLGTAALRAHQNNGGVLLFVVDIDLRGERNEPKYAILTPFEIRRILENASEDQKTISIALSKLPRLPGAVERIVEVAIAGKRQNPRQRTDMRIFETMKKITLFTVEETTYREPTSLTPGDTVFAMEITTESGDRVPVDGGIEVVPQDYVPHDRRIRISSGAAVFERATVQRLTHDTSRITWEGGLSLDLGETPANPELTLTVEFSNNFAARKRAIEFLVGLVDSDELHIGDHVLRHHGLSMEKVTETEELRDHLAFLGRLDELFIALSVDGALVDLGGLTDEHYAQLRGLYDIFVRGESAGNSGNQPGRMFIGFGTWGVLILALEGDEPGTWRFIDPFNPSSAQMLRWRDELETLTIPITAYDMIAADVLPQILNMRLDLITDAYERIANAPDAVGLANQRVRDLLLCVDADPDSPRRNDFLDAAQRLNEWIIEHDEDIDPHLLNRWQIAWRQGGISDADRLEIRALRHRAARASDTRSSQRELAASLLLGEHEEVDFLSEQMADDALAEMRSWPIWMLRDGSPGTGDTTPALSAPGTEMPAGAGQ